jgi:hypothetical protein
MHIPAGFVGANSADAAMLEARFIVNRRKTWLKRLMLASSAEREGKEMRLVGISVLLLSLVPAWAEEGGLASYCFNSEAAMAWCQAHRPRMLLIPEPPVREVFPKIQVPDLPAEPSPLPHDCVNIGLVMPPGVVCRVE